eukprot:15346160-Ditylum_brightwellii.AAC.1
MGPCDDTVVIKETYKTTSSIIINGGAGNDKIQVGSSKCNGGFDGCIFSDITIAGGDGEHDSFIVDDSRSKLDKKSTVRVGSITGLHEKNTTSISYRGIETLDLRLSRGENSLDIVSSAKGCDIHVTCQDESDKIVLGTHIQEGDLSITTGGGNDNVTINSTKGYLDLDTGAGDDEIYVYGLGFDAVIYGGDGTDKLFVDGGSNQSADEVVPLTNKLDGTRLRWSGGEGDDEVTAYFLSTGTTNLDLFDDPVDKTGNRIFVECSDLNCTVLNRATFLANIHTPGSNSSTLERINIADNAIVTSLQLNLNGGDNSMFFDDTFAITTVYGGEGEDSFHIGQMYNSDRANETESRVSTDDPIHTTLTTRGYLSDGCSASYGITINSGGGNDKFDVLRNECILDLNGESGDDFFVVRSFIAVIADDGETLLNPELGKISLFGGDEDDIFDVQEPSDEDILVFDSDFAPSASPSASPSADPTN